MKRTWLQALAAVLAGNALYFVVLMPRLPAAAQHGVGRLDLGLAIDFLLCGALYALIRRLDHAPKADPRAGKGC